MMLEKIRMVYMDNGEYFLEVILQSGSVRITIDLPAKDVEEYLFIIGKIAEKKLKEEIV